MTAQIAERLIYRGKDLAMCTNPLSDYFAMGGTNPRFEPDLQGSALGKAGAGLAGSPWVCVARRDRDRSVPRFLALVLVESVALEKRVV